MAGRLASGQYHPAAIISGTTILFDQRFIQSGIIGLFCSAGMYIYQQ